MSEGSRGTQAPSRPDEAIDSNGDSHNGDDFYATVNNAAASRSTRIKLPEGAAGSAGYSDLDRYGSREDSGDGMQANGAHVIGYTPESSAVDLNGDGVTEPDPESGQHGEVEDTADDVASTGARTSWRDRWTSLTGSFTRRKDAADGAVVTETTSEPVAVAEGADPVATGAPNQPASRFARPVTPAVSSTAIAVPAAAGAVAVPSSDEVKTTPAPKPKLGAPHRTRKARLRLSRIDPWSVMKTSFLFSIAAGIVLVVAVYVIWTVVGSSGLFSSINEIVSSVVSAPGDTTPFRIEEYLNTQKVMGVTAFVACIDVVIFTALATLMSFLYNLASTMLGGLEVTLAED